MDAKVLTSKEIEAIREELNRGVIDDPASTIHSLLDTLDATKEELAKLRKKIAYEKGSFF